MKRFFAGVIVGAVVATAAGAVAAGQNIRLIVNGQDVAFSDAPPQMINGRVMVPARPLAEALGASVTWDSAQGAVVVASSAKQATSAPNASNGLVTPTRATFGQELAFKHFTARIKNVSYQATFQGFAAREGFVLAVVEVQVEARDVSVEPVQNPGGLIWDWALDDGSTYDGGGSSADAPELRPNTTATLHIFHDVPAGSKLAGVSVHSPYPEDFRTIYSVQLQ